MKSVLRSAKPYWVYLILTGKKTVEVGKDCPKSEDWNRIVEMYCSKDMRSFNRIPEADREWMRKYLGKVACRFVCDRIGELYQCNSGFVAENACIGRREFFKYLGIPYDTHGGYDKKCYGWHISDLKIYDKPKELGEFRKPDTPFHAIEETSRGIVFGDGWRKGEALTRPPQSWQFVDEI